MCETEQFLKGYQTKIEETPSAAHKKFNQYWFGWLYYVDFGKNL